MLRWHYPLHVGRHILIRRHHYYYLNTATVVLSGNDSSVCLASAHRAFSCSKLYISLQLQFFFSVLKILEFIFIKRILWRSLYIQFLAVLLCIFARCSQNPPRVKLFCIKWVTLNVLSWTSSTRSWYFAVSCWLLGLVFHPVFPLGA